MAKAIRYSRQRERIYEYLTSTTEHPSAEMIHSDLRDEIPDLSLGTVYRNLNLLVELGKIRKVITHEGNERYDSICHDHAHFVCQCCGSIQDIPHIDSARIQRNLALDDGYQISKLDMILTGTCPVCSERENGEVVV